MLKNILKKSGWTDVIVSILFILFGIMLIARPNEVISMISVLLGLVFVILGISKIAEYFSNNKQERYLLPVATILILLGIVIMFCTNLILSIFRIILAVWIIYTGLMNLYELCVWKEYTSRLWLLSLLFTVLMLILGVYILINTGAIMQTIGIILIVYGIVNIIQNFIFIKKIDDYL